MSGNTVLEGSCPKASVYSGHQFGVWAGQLGDGRAISLGEINTPLGIRDIQLKGAGPTPFRGGVMDGQYYARVFGSSCVARQCLV